MRAVATPLICGNSVILKPSEHSVKSQRLVAEVFREAGLPDGVLNFLSMSPKQAPSLTEYIIQHKAVRRVTFTGSDSVGRYIAAYAARVLKPCVLELGGKAPLLVLEDANLDDAANAIVYGALFVSLRELAQIRIEPDLPDTRFCIPPSELRTDLHVDRANHRPQVCCI